MSDPVKCKKCRGSGTNRAGKCATCKGSGKVTISTDESGATVVKAAQ